MSISITLLSYLKQDIVLADGLQLENSLVGILLCKFNSYFDKLMLYSTKSEELYFNLCNFHQKNL